jgi:hypothetical protein
MRCFDGGENASSFTCLGCIRHQAPAEVGVEGFLLVQIMVMSINYCGPQWSDWMCCSDRRSNWSLLPGTQPNMSDIISME